MSKHLLVKHIPTSGPRQQLLDFCEVQFLNRVPRWIVPSFRKAPERLEIEVDPRHAELLIKNPGLQQSSKEMNTAGERPRDSSRTVKLSPQDATSYSSNVMRLAYFSVRIKSRSARKELTRAMSEVTTANVEASKRCVRFLLKHPRCIQSVERQEIVFKITCFIDANFAGCLQSRKSTSSCQSFHEKHLLKSTSTTQAVAVSRMPKPNSTQRSRQQLREFVVFQWCATLEWFCINKESKSKRKVYFVESTVLDSRSSWMQRQAEPLQCEEVVDASDTSQPRHCGCHASWSMETSRWPELVEMRTVLTWKQNIWITRQWTSTWSFGECVLRKAGARLHAKMEFFSTSIPVGKETSGSPLSATPRHEQRLELGMENLVWRHSPNVQNCDLVWTATSQGGRSKSRLKVTFEWVHECW